MTLNQKETDGEADGSGTQRPLIQGVHGDGDHKASALERRQSLPPKKPVIEEGTDAVKHRWVI